jgi:hypothetical protein
MPRMAGLGDMRRMMADTGVHIVDNAHMFGVQMDTSAYKPEEIDVKVRARLFHVYVCWHWQVHDENKHITFLMVTGKHEEKADEHGFISRHFTRRFTLPKDVNIQELHCNLSNEGLFFCFSFAPHHFTCRRSDAAGAAQAPNGQQHPRHSDHARRQRAHARREEAFRQEACRALERPLGNPPFLFFCSHVITPHVALIMFFFCFSCFNY